MPPYLCSPDEGGRRRMIREMLYVCTWCKCVTTGCSCETPMTSISPASGFALVFLVFCVCTTCCCLVGREQRRKVTKNKAVYLKRWGPAEYRRYYNKEPEDAVLAASNDVLPTDRYDPEIDRQAGEGPNAGRGGDTGGFSRLPAIIAI